MKPVKSPLALITVACLLTISLDTRQAQAQNRHQNAYGLGMDLVWYCSYRHGSSGRLVLRENNAYGWKCEVNGQDLDIDVFDVCRSIYGGTAQPVMGNFNDRNSWYCTNPVASSSNQNVQNMAQSGDFSYQPSPRDLKKADELARETAAWFHYTTGRMDSDRLGQCGDYAVMFVLKYNAYAGKNVARLVVANNPIPSGTYRIGEKVDVGKLGFNGFDSGASGFLIWNGKQYIYHPVLGAYEIFIEKAWTPKRHFGVDMLDKNQVHVWASIGDVSVDPTYFDSGNYPSPLGTDE
jgi:hypothetical protein